MLSSLRYQVRTWPIVWRGRLFYYWLTGENNGLGFFAMLGLPVIALGSIIWFAYADGLSNKAAAEQARLEAARQRAADLRCLAENIYFEARGEPIAGQRAVAEVTLNRVRSRFFPDTVCEVVHESRWDPIRRRRIAAFSWTELRVRHAPQGRAWEEAMAAATAVYDEVHTPVVPGALFYHATYVDPYWAGSKKQLARIGQHVFYR